MGNEIPIIGRSQTIFTTEASTSTNLRRNKMKRFTTVLVILAFVASLTVAFASEPATPKKEPVKRTAVQSINVTGAVSVMEVNKKKVAMITAEDGAQYHVAGAQAAKLIKLDGKKVKATGTVKEAEGVKTLTVKTCSEVK